MIETPVVFGADHHLIGILTMPKRDAFRAQLPAVLMSNVGLNHRVGPFRLWVEVARALAAQGVASLRFDSSGLGDSRQRIGTLDDRSRLALDMKEALSHALQKSGCKGATVIGLCSGTDAAHEIAVADPRVQRAMFIDGYAYRTAGFYWHHWLNRVRQTKRWKMYVRRRFPSRQDRAKVPQAFGEGAEIYSREYPTHTQFKNDVSSMLSRGTRLGFVYSGEVDYQLNHAEQFWQMFDDDLRQRIDYLYRPSADHVFSNRHERTGLLQHLVRFASAA